MKKFWLFLLILLLVGCTKTESLERNMGLHEVMYFVMTDRFYDGDETNNQAVNKADLSSYHGGDFKGLREKLDYIEGLGATAIWITPVQKNTPGGYHGYWIDDFYAIEPHLGTIDDLRALVKDMHSRDMKLIVDFVINHTGYNSSLLEEHPDWFHPDKTIHNWSDKEQVETGWLAGLPDFDQSNPEVAKYLIDSALWLIEETGIDGFRLDTVKHVDLDFWITFTEAILEKHPNFYFMGEVYDYNPPVLNHYKQAGIDGMLNYPMFKAIQAAFRPGGSMRAIEAVYDRAKNDPTPNLNGMFIDNHDNMRFLTQVGENGEDYLRQAITFIMTTRQIPVIYYGTEVGLEGGEDPDNRRPFPWNDTQNILEPLWSKLLELRDDEVYLNGRVTILETTDEYILYQIEWNEDRYIVGMNNRNESVGLTREITGLTNFLYPDQAVDFILPPRGIVIYRSN